MTASFDAILVQGDATIQGSILPKRTKSSILQQRSIEPFNVPFENWRKYDSFGEVLPTASSGDDLGLAVGTHGTGAPNLITADGDNADTTWYARQSVRLPAEYVGGQTVQLSLYAGMVGAVSDTLATLDIQAIKCNREGGVSGVELYTGSAVSVNSLTFAEATFSLTPTTLSPGDLIDVQLAARINDGGTGSSVQIRIGDVRLLVDTL